MGSKRVKLEEEEEDRISDLPDHIIHHILSLLPSTKQVIQTSVLSKRWQEQWTRVPVLKFDSTGMSYENFLRLINNTLILHDCSNIKKFDLRYHYPDKKDPQFNWKIYFAIRKHVEELNLMSSIKQQYKLPQFFFNNTSLVKLRALGCSFMPNGKVNWGSLASLSIWHCKLTHREMEHILSGSPLLKSLLLSSNPKLTKLVIASNYLKKLSLRHLHMLVYIEISCPQLEKLNLIICSKVRTAKLLNLPSSLDGCIDFCSHNREEWRDEIHRSLIKDILQQLKHVKKLNFGDKFFEVLSGIEVGGLTSLVLNIKYLILNFPSLNKHYNGIAYILRISTVLEKIIIRVPVPDQDYGDYGENFWNLNATVYNCLESHLKIIKIIGVPKRDDNCKLVLNFIRFLLKNARVLQEVVIVLDDETDSEFKLSWFYQELTILPRCSQNVTFRLLCSE